MSIPTEILANLPARVDKPKDKPVATSTMIARRKRILFLEKLRECGQVTAAAQAIGYKNAAAINQARRNDENFDREVMAARIEYVETHVEDEIIRRAMLGRLKPVRHKGVVVGYDREPSDTLILAVAKANNPKKWGDNKTVDINHTKKVGVVILAEGPQSVAEWEMESVRVHEEQQRLKAGGAPIVEAMFEEVKSEEEYADFLKRGEEPQPEPEKEVTLEDLL